MPVERQDLDLIFVLRFHVTKNRKHEYECEAEQANDHVKCMQSHQREVGSSEEVCRDGQAFVVNQSLPLAGSSVEKNHTQRDRGEPPSREFSYVSLVKGFTR